MSRSSKNKLKKARESANQSNLLEHNFSAQDQPTAPKRKRKRSKKSKEQTSPEQPRKKQSTEEEKVSTNQLEPNRTNLKMAMNGDTPPKSNADETEDIILSDDQAKLQRAITLAIRRTNKEDLNALLSPITRDVGILLSLKESLQQQTLELQNIKLENSELKRRCTKMELEHDQLKSRISVLEDTKLEGNVIFHGIPESQWESDLTEKIYSYMSMTATGDETSEVKLEKVKKFKITQTTRLGQKSEGRTRPVRVRYEDADAVNILLSSKKNLPRGIFVDREYSATTTKNRRILRPYFNAAKNSNEFYRKCRMEGDVLIINSKRYTVNNLSDLPESLNGFHANSRSNTDTFAFFGEDNPLSNFHPSKFEIKGKTYRNGQQYTQSEKAKYFDDEETSKKIMNATTGLVCKKLSKEVKNYRHDEWKRVAHKISEPGLIAKYNQNAQLMNLLQSTGNQLIVEASRDTVWGTGIPLNSKDVLDRTKWTSNGILSDILMRVRSLYREDAEQSMEQESPASGTAAGPASATASSSTAVS